MTQEEQMQRRSVSFLVASIVIHLLLVLFLFVGSEYQSSRPPSPPITPPDVQFVDMDSLPELDKRTLVEQAEDEKASKVKPKDAKYMSKVDKSVEKETKAVHRGDFQNANNSQPAPPSSPQQAKAPKQEEGGEDQKPASDFGDVAVAKKKKPKSLKDLHMNSMDEMTQQAFAAVSQTNDHLKNVAMGAQTQLNTREFLYYTYFNRIRKKLRQHWEPIIHKKVRDMHRRGRELASDQTKTTRVIIILDARGFLSRVQLSTTSGVVDLDEAAMEALKESAPFPNPPDDLIVNGYVSINWDFILES